MIYIVTSTIKEGPAYVKPTDATKIQQDITVNVGIQGDTRGFLQPRFIRCEWMKAGTDQAAIDAIIAADALAFVNQNYNNP